MSFPKVKMYLVVVTVMPQKEGMDIPHFIQRVEKLLLDYSTATKYLYRFKVSGESKVLSVVQVANMIGLERTVGGLMRIGPVQVDCHPIVGYENFASRSLKVDPSLTKPNSGALSKEGLYWLEFDVGYAGKSTDELINVWRKEAEAVLTARYKEGTSIELYKVVAERKVHVFINASDPEQIDQLSLQLPIMQENGANVEIKCKALQFLDDYTSRITSESI